MMIRPDTARVRTTARGIVVVACAAVPILGTSLPAHSQDNGVPVNAAPGKVADFNLTAVAGVVDFRVSYPDLILPFVISGGMLESTSVASGVGQAEGMAGPMPVPAMNSGGLLAPTNVPGTEIPVPEEARKGYGSIDFTRFPNACLSRYPAIREGDEEAYCGGSALGDEAAGGSAALANGHTTSTGDPDDPLQSRATSVSRAGDVAIPGLQTTVHNGWAKTSSGLNVQDGVPESRAETHADQLSFVGGVVQFTGVRSSAVVRTDGTDAGTSVQTAFSFQEASVTGIPVVIGPDGVSVNGEKLGDGQSPRQAAAQLGQALKGHDLEIRFVPAPPPIRENGQISVQSAGIEIVHRGSSVTPADSVYRFGFAAARGNAVGDAGGADLSAGGDTRGHDVLPTDTASTSSDDSALGGDAFGGVEGSLPGDLPAVGSGESSLSFTDDISDAPAGLDATPGQDSGATDGGSGEVAAPPVASLRTAPKSLPRALVASSVAVQPLNYNSLTRTFGGVLAVACLAAAGLPLRRKLSRR